MSNIAGLTDAQVTEVRTLILSEAEHVGYRTQAQVILDRVLPAVTPPAAPLTAEQIDNVTRTISRIAGEAGYSREAEGLIGQVASALRG